MTDKHRKILYAAAIVIFILFFAAVMWFVGRPLVNFISEPEKFRLWVDSHGIWGRLAFLGMTVLQVIVALIPGEPMEIGAGYAFGAVEGTALCLLGILIGGAAIFLFVRKFGVKAVEVFFPLEKINSLPFMRDARKLNTVTFLLMLIPGTPKDLLSYAAGLTDMKLSTWLLISTVARIPSVLTSTVGGAALGSGDTKTAVVVFAVTAVISAVGFAVYQRITARREKKD